MFSALQGTVQDQDTELITEESIARDVILTGKQGGLVAKMKEIRI